jgi:hypothetical protein
MFIVRITPPVDAEIVELERRIAMFRATHAAVQPTLGELMRHAVEGTDFLGDIDRDAQILAVVAANAADVAAEQWEEGHSWPREGVPLALIHDVTAALMQYARDLFAAEDEARAEVRPDCDRGRRHGRGRERDPIREVPKPLMAARPEACRHHRFRR